MPARKVYSVVAARLSVGDRRNRRSLAAGRGHAHWRVGRGAGAELRRQTDRETRRRRNRKGGAR